LSFPDAADAANRSGPQALARERLERALAADELTLFCQPIRALEGGSGYPMAEVLVRMRYEERALLPPGEFLPVFEELGIMPQLDRWVVRHVVQRLKAGSRIPTFTINLSGQTLADASFPAFVVGELKTSGVAPGAICFELDEADLAADLDRACVAATALKLVGSGVIIDSFGATARSLTHLKHLRVDLVKVDGMIVRKLLTSAAARSLLDAVLRIAKTLGIGVIGTSVEEQDILLRLKSLGVGYAQGFGIHEPSPLYKFAS
jgi:EAL domain-containing protein (putative c-di-GMP-specific phosphodiesterase class I)